MGTPRKKVPVVRHIPATEKHSARGKKIRMVRKVSNKEIVREAVEARGFCRVLVQFKLRDHASSGYVGFNGTNLAVDATSWEKADQFVKLMRVAAIEIAGKLEMEVPNSVVVER